MSFIRDPSIGDCTSHLGTRHIIYSHAPYACASSINFDFKLEEEKILEEGKLVSNKHGCSQDPETNKWKLCECYSVILSHTQCPILEKGLALGGCRSSNTNWNVRKAKHPRQIWRGTSSRGSVPMGAMDTALSMKTIWSCEESHPTSWYWLCNGVVITHFIRCARKIYFISKSCLSVPVVKLKPWRDPRLKWVPWVKGFSAIMWKFGSN